MKGAAKPHSRRKMDESEQAFITIPTHKKDTDLSRSVSLHLVEARGVEPLSEDNATKASTGVVTVLMSSINECTYGFILRALSIDSKYLSINLSSSAFRILERIGVEYRILYI